MATGPGDEPEAAGHGHLRASHADREQVIGTLKAAFVQGRLTKDELAARAGQAFAARTHAGLAALTADLPAGLADDVAPAGAVRARARQPMSNAAKAGIRGLVLAVAVPVVWLFATGDPEPFLLFAPVYCLALVLGAEILISRHKNRSRPNDPGQRVTLAGTPG